MQCRRRGEILAIRWSALDLEHSRLTVHQSVSQTRKQRVFFKGPKKKKKSRHTITLPAIIMDAIREQRIQQQRHKELFGPDYQDWDLLMATPDAAYGHPIALLTLCPKP
jgi:integrase